jgi:putative RecB family exonuclease
MTVATAPPPARAREPDPNELAQQLTGRDYLSYSAVSTFQRCPRRYQFHYVAGLAPAFKSSSLVFGRAVHAAVELHWRSMFEAGSPPSVDDLMAAYEKAWREDAAPEVKFGKNESETSVADLARRMLTAFQSSPLSQLDGTVLGIEEELRAPVIPGCPDLLGRIDLITVTEGNVRLIDFKTSRAKWGDAKVEESAPQMLLYSELVSPIAEAYGDLPIRLEWIVATKTKDPSLSLHTLDADPRRVAWTKAAFRQAWRAIASGHFYPCPSTQGCSTCPYVEPCRTWRG